MTKEKKKTLQWKWTKGEQSETQNKNEANYECANQRNKRSKRKTMKRCEDADECDDSRNWWMNNVFVRFAVGGNQRKNSKFILFTFDRPQRWRRSAKKNCSFR